MKKNQYLMSLLLVILLSSCFTSRINYEKLSRIQLGMSSGGVIAILGKPTYRSFDKKEDTSSRIRVTTDGKHIIQTGSIIVTPDGKHETVVSDLGGIIITGSGEHIHVH